MDRHVPPRHVLQLLPHERHLEFDGVALLRRDAAYIDALDANKISGTTIPHEIHFAEGSLAEKLDSLVGVHGQLKLAGVARRTATLA